MWFKKGQASSMYTLLGVLLTAIFALFLFVTQSGNQAQNLETLVTTDVSFNSEMELRGLYTRSFPVPREDNMKIATAVSHACEYGKKSEGYAFTISEPKGLRVETSTFLKSYFNKTLNTDYRFSADCGDSTDKEIIVGEEIPENPDKVVSSTMEVPLAGGNRSEVMIKRW
jgi:hypothetical protein